MRSVTFVEGASTTICILRRSTGIPCPGCGLTRACIHLAHGEWAAAVTDHPLALLLVAEVVIVWLLIGVSLWRSRAASGVAMPGLFEAPGSSRWLNLWLTSHVVGFGALWIGRMATGTLPW